MAPVLIGYDSVKHKQDLNSPTDRTHRCQLTTQQTAGTTAASLSTFELSRFSASVRRTDKSTAPVTQTAHISLIASTTGSAMWNIVTIIAGSLWSVWRYACLSVCVCRSRR